MTRRRGRGLSDEDRALWARLAATARPLRPARREPPQDPAAAAPDRATPDRAAPGSGSGGDRAAGRPAPPAAAAPSRPPGTMQPAAAPTRDGPPPARQRPTVLRPDGAPEPRVAWRTAPEDRPRPASAITPGLDRGTARRLARGRREPEARLDLHGMTADRAHAALNRFVSEGVAQGLRCVLVVTGMGRGPESGHRGDGVLRRETPRWLGVAPLAGHVVGVFEAHSRHGGAGALYVYLRRRR